MQKRTKIPATTVWYRLTPTTWEYFCLLNAGKYDIHYHVFSTDSDVKGTTDLSDIITSELDDFTNLVPKGEKSYEMNYNLIENASEEWVFQDKDGNQFMLVSESDSSTVQEDLTDILRQLDELSSDSIEGLEDFLDRIKICTLQPVSGLGEEISFTSSDVLACINKHLIGTGIAVLRDGTILNSNLDNEKVDAAPIAIAEPEDSSISTNP